MSFSWVPFYRELAGRVLEFEDKQDELLQFVLQMHTDGFFGKTAKTLDGIDPFTFFSLINVLGLEKRKAACAFLAGKWGLKTESPSDFFGVPEINPQGCWFFDYEPKRTSFDIPSLWELAKAVCSQSRNSDIEPLFFSCLQIHTVGFIKMTIGLFWFAPERFLPLDQHMKAMLKRSDIYWNEKAFAKGDWGTYLSILEQIKIVLGDDFPQISRDAWLEKDLNKVVAPSLPFEVTTEATAPEAEPLKTKMPLNQILYGPPGTGKTYSSIRRAVQIIDGEEGGNPKARFEELRKAGQIEFVTFHQSFSYEEFIEGLRPVIGDESGQVSYEIRPGILKKIALRASSTASVTSSEAQDISGIQVKGTTQSLEFGNLWKQFLRIYEPNPAKKLEGLTNKFCFSLKFQEHQVTATNTIQKNQTVYKVTCRHVQEVFEKLAHGERPDADTILKAVGPERRSLFQHKTPLLGAIIQELRRLSKSQTNQNVASNSVKAAVETQPVEFKDGLPVAHNLPKFVLIIDEINRGNISKILGELITLLEDDKRIGAENELRLTLPTSGETFALPPNLYILGTMNTSDKSLAQLDVALRRRFSFEEMPPILSLCNQLDGLPAVLKELNDRLEWALDREHRLGHAYFMGVDSAAAFDAIFRSKIVPLLIEYFPHDFQTLRAVLGEKSSEKSDGFLREMTKPKDFPGSAKKYRWWFESGDADFSAFERLRSNYEV